MTNKFVFHCLLWGDRSPRRLLTAEVSSAERTVNRSGFEIYKTTIKKVDVDFGNDHENEFNAYYEWQFTPTLEEARRRLLQVVFHNASFDDLTTLEWK